MAKRHCSAAFALMALLSVLLVATTAVAATPEGDIDLAFGSCGVSTHHLRDATAAQGGTGDAVAVQPDGKIVVAGATGVTRLLPDGSLDYRFGYQGSVFVNNTHEYSFERLRVAAVIIQPDGRILVGGTATSGLRPSVDFSFARYLADGTPDTSFGSGGTVTVSVNDWLFAMTLQADGKIVAGGHGLVRLTANGILDPTFGSGGIVHRHGVTSLTTQADGKIVAGVRVSGVRNSDFGILRLLPDGRADPAFGTDGVVSYDTSGHDDTYAVAVDERGRLVTVGVLGMTDPSAPHGVTMLRHLPNGSLDETFGDGGIRVVALSDTSMTLESVVFQPDGKVVVLAIDPAYAGVPTLARFTVEGRLDPTFGTGGRSTVSLPGLEIRSLARTPDGDLVMGGSNSREGSLVALRFRGTGAPVGAPVTAATCTKEVSLSPVLSDFGTWTVGARSTPRTFTLTSTGTAPVRVGRVELSTHARGQYVLLSDGCGGRTLTPGSSCPIKVAFNPSILTGPAYSAPNVTVWDDARNGAHITHLRSVARPPVRPFGWGWNGFGQVGTGTPEGSPVEKPLNLPNAASLSAGWYHSLAVNVDGTVSAWGWNAFGQLGDGTRVSRSTPVRIPGFTNIASVVAGAYQSFAIGRDGTVWAWGLNVVGELGDGTTVDRLSPVRLGSLPPIRSLAGGFAHTLAVASDGTVWAWGWNMFGQLGDGTTVDRLAPVPVPGLANIQLVSAGVAHSVAVTEGSGKVSAWGWNAFGQLGTGTTVDQHRPTPVPGLEAVVDIAAGGYHTVAALGHAGPPMAWGWNVFGQLGDGTTTDRHRPVPVRMSDTVNAVAAGVFHSVALTTGDVVKGWGWNDFGQAGDGAPVKIRSIPTAGVKMTGVSVVAAGVLHSITG